MADAAVEVAEVAPDVHRLALPLGIQGIPTLSAYLLRAPSGDTLVDCGIAAGPGEEACAALDAALRACGSAVEQVARLVVTHAHIDHFGLAGEVVRRSGGDLCMHRRTDLDLAKYGEPDEAVDRAELMLADHGLFGPELTASATGLREWMPVMPSIGRPTVLLDGGERIAAGDRAVGGGRDARALTGARLPLVAGRPAPVLRRPPAADRVAARDVRAGVRARPDGLLPGVPGAGGAAGTGARAPRPRSAVRATARGGPG